MVSQEKQGAAPARRSRRAVRHAGTVGGDDANLVSVHPALTPEPGPPAHAVAASPEHPGAGHTSRDGARPEQPDPGGATQREGDGQTSGGGDGQTSGAASGLIGGGTGMSSLEADAASRARSTSRSGALDRSADDTDLGWGEVDPGSNDERLASDKPPHW